MVIKSTVKGLTDPKQAFNDTSMFSFTLCMWFGEQPGSHSCRRIKQTVTSGICQELIRGKLL